MAEREKNTAHTFRPIRDGVAWQKELRDRYLREGAPTSVLDLGKAIVRPVSRELAKSIILKYEWLGTMAATSAHFGIFFGPYCAGVTCVGGTNVLAGAFMPGLFEVEHRDLLVLARGACVHWAPAGTNSKLVAWTVRLLRKAKAGKILVAFSDSDAGEIGTIYQACGWTFIGAGSSVGEWVSPAGKVHNQAMIGRWIKEKGGTWAAWTKALRDEGWKEQPSNPKGRYVQILDERDSNLRAIVDRLRRPYPKRAGSGHGDTEVDQTSKGGSSPTPAL